MEENLIVVVRPAQDRRFGYLGAPGGHLQAAVHLVVHASTEGAYVIMMTTTTLGGAALIIIIIIIIEECRSESGG